MRASLVVFAAGFSVAVCGPAPAQVPRSGEAARTIRIVERNHLGLLAYCRERGLVESEAVDRQRRVLGALPVAEDAALGAAEEALGRDGVIAFGESRTTLAADAAAEGISVAYDCFQIALRAMPRETR